MTRDSVAGFMLGVSAGVAIGYFLKPPNESGDSIASHERNANTQTKQAADHLRRFAVSVPPAGKTGLRVERDAPREISQELRTPRAS